MINTAYSHILISKGSTMFVLEYSNFDIIIRAK
jgi:hypothetical protein